MKKIIISLSIVAAAFSVSYSETKIAVVNPVTVFNQTDLGSLSVKKLENELSPEATKLKKQQNAIMQQMQNLQNDSDTMTKEQLTAKQTQIEQERQNFVNQAKVLQQKEYTKKEELQNNFQISFSKAVNTISKQKGYNLVYTTESLVYVQGVDDISEDVVAVMNKGSN